MGQFTKLQTTQALPHLGDRGKNICELRCQPSLYREFQASYNETLAQKKEKKKSNRKELHASSLY